MSMPQDSHPAKIASGLLQGRSMSTWKLKGILAAGLTGFCDLGPYMFCLRVPYQFS